MVSNAVSRKTMENVRKHKDRRNTTERGRNYLVSEPNFHTTKFFTENVLATEMKKRQILMNTVYLGLSILKLSEILMYEFWYDYIKPEYDEKAKLCYIDTDSFIVYIKTDYIYNDIAENVETRFDTSNFN